MPAHGPQGGLRAPARALAPGDRIAAMQLRSEAFGQSPPELLRSLPRLDFETIAKSGRADAPLCVDEGWSAYGITAEISSRIPHGCFAELDPPSSASD
jgi:hypothetical protein